VEHHERDAQAIEAAMASCAVKLARCSELLVEETRSKGEALRRLSETEDRLRESERLRSTATMRLSSAELELVRLREALDASNARAVLAHRAAEEQAERLKAVEAAYAALQAHANAEIAELRTHVASIESSAFRKAQLLISRLRRKG
jgi:hypothetical protein